MTINKPYENNEHNNHDVNNSAPKAFAGNNEPSSFTRIRLASSCKLNYRAEPYLAIVLLISIN